jgi:hypothetical protein
MKALPEHWCHGALRQILGVRITVVLVDLMLRLKQIRHLLAEGAGR